MSHAIRRSEVKQRRCCCRGGNLFIDLGPSPVSQKYWTSLRAQHQHVTCAIVFFIASRALVFTNRTVVVLVDGTNGCDSDLLVVPHDQAIEIQTWLRLLFEWTASDQPFEILDCLSINCIAVEISAGRQ